MSLPMPPALPNSSAASTSPFSGDVVSSQTTERQRVGLVGRSEPSSVEEVQRILRQRLRILAVIAGCVVPIVLAVELPAVVRTSHWGYLVLCGILVAMTAVCSVLVWSRLNLSLFSLRCVEMTIVITCSGCIVAWQAHNNLIRGRDAAILATVGETKLVLPVIAAKGGPANDWNIQLGTSVMQQFGASYNELWMGLIFGYGLFIPNSLRRATLVIGGMALLAFLANVLIVVFDAAVRGQMAGMLLWQSAGWMGATATMAILGSYRIERMRQAAAQARKLGQYQLLHQIGQGGMGEVYLAEHTLLRRPCAIKLIRAERAGDPKNLVRFEREVQATATLTNWHTVEVFDYGRAQDGTFYYVMEYLPGLNLEQMVKQYGPLPASRVVYLLRQVCAALREAHGIGLIHRDIKPSNIIVGQRGGLADVAKLLDFGLALAHEFTGSERITQEGVIAGTPSYMSPEQAGGVGAVDGRSDIYSLGAVAFFLLTGRPPFVGQSAMQVLAAHLHQAAPSPREFAGDCPEDLARVVMRCLEKEPARRFEGAQALERPLATCQCAGIWTDSCAAAWWREKA